MDVFRALEARFLGGALDLGAFDRAGEQDSLPGMLGRAPGEHHFEVRARPGERLQLRGSAAGLILDHGHPYVVAARFDRHGSLLL